MSLKSKMLPQFEQLRGYEVIGASSNYVKLRDATGVVKDYLDFNSGCWNVPLGHNNPEINALFQLGYYSNPFGLSNPHANRCAEELCRISGASNVVFSTSGSEAVDIALRLAWQSVADENLCKRDKKYVLSIKGGYHGSTGLALYVDGYSNYAAYLPIVTNDYPEDHFSIKLPDPLKNMRNIKRSIEKLIQGREKKIASIIFEPIMGIRGAVPLPDDYVSTLVDLSNKYGARIIVDEVTTGFGRTGKMFGFEYYDIKPDIICIGKAITNGAFPMGATLFNDEVRCRIEQSQSSDFGKYLYGHTLSAQPAGCMMASKVIKIIERDGLVSKIREKGEYLREELEHLTELEFVRDIRGRGLFNSVEVLDSNQAREIIRDLMVKGIFVKNEGRNLMLVPPYTISKEEINYFIVEFSKVLKAHS